LSLEVSVPTVHGIVKVIPPILEERIVKEGILDGGGDAFLLLQVF
jgi:hypothetical protein